MGLSSILEPLPSTSPPQPTQEVQVDENSVALEENLPLTVLGWFQQGIHHLGGLQDLLQGRASKAGQELGEAGYGCPPLPHSPLGFWLGEAVCRGWVWRVG